MNWPGRYNHFATMVRDATHAQGVVLIVFEGEEGHGFSVQAASPSFGLRLPRILEDVAAQLRASQNGQGGH